MTTSSLPLPPAWLIPALYIAYAAYKMHTSRQSSPIPDSAEQVPISVEFFGGRPVDYYEDTRWHLGQLWDVPLAVTATKLDRKQDAEKFLELFLPHVESWRSLRLDVRDPEAAEAVIKALSESEEVPKLLEALSLVGDSPKSFLPFRGKAPALRQLEVRGMSLDWTETPFESLEYMYLSSPSWTDVSFLGTWKQLKTLVIHLHLSQELVFPSTEAQFDMPALEDLGLSNFPEAAILQFFATIKLPVLSRLLLTQIKNSPIDVTPPILPLDSVKSLRVHAADISGPNLLSLLLQMLYLDSLSFEDSSPIPSFISDLTPSDVPATWIVPSMTSLTVAAFEDNNRTHEYGASDIEGALKHLATKRRSEREVEARMCLYEGDRDSVGWHAMPWGVEGPFKLVHRLGADGRVEPSAKL